MKEVFIFVLLEEYNMASEATRIARYYNNTKGITRVVKKRLTTLVASEGETVGCIRR